MSKEVNEERTPRTVEDVKEMLTKHSNGEIQRTIQNCITILQNDHVLADAIRLNLLSERIDIVKPVGWPRAGKTLNDTDMISNNYDPLPLLRLREPDPQNRCCRD